MDDLSAPQGLRKPSATSSERDILARLVTDLSRTYAQKTNGQEKVWNEVPAGWPSRLKWKNPTTAPKDNKNSLKEKIDFLISKIPLKKRSELLAEKIRLYKTPNLIELKELYQLVEIIGTVSNFEKTFQNSRRREQIINATATFINSITQELNIWTGKSGGNVLKRPACTQSSNTPTKMFKPSLNQPLSMTQTTKDNKNTKSKYRSILPKPDKNEENKEISGSANFKPMYPEWVSEQSPTFESGVSTAYQTSSSNSNSRQAYHFTENTHSETGNSDRKRAQLENGNPTATCLLTSPTQGDHNMNLSVMFSTLSSPSSVSETASQENDSAYETESSPAGTTDNLGENKIVCSPKSRSSSSPSYAHAVSQYPPSENYAVDLNFNRSIDFDLNDYNPDPIVAYDNLMKLADNC